MVIKSGLISLEWTEIESPLILAIVLHMLLYNEYSNPWVYIFFTLTSH